MYDLDKLRAIGAPAWYLNQLQKLIEVHGFLSIEDIASPLVLQLGYTQAVNKRLANLERKLERERAAAQTQVDKLTQEKLGWESTNRSRNKYIAGLQKENEQLQKDMLRGLPHGGVFGELKKTYAERDELKVKLAAAERTMQTTLELGRQASLRAGALSYEVQRLQRELKGATERSERWCNDFHAVRQERDEARANEGKWANHHDEQLALHLEAKDTAEQLRKDLVVERKNTDIFRNDALAVRKQVAVLRADLTQAVAAKDAAVEQAKEWKRKYQDRKNLDFGFLYGANVAKVLGHCHDEITVSQEDAKRLADQYKKEFPGIWSCFHPAHKNLVDSAPLTKEDIDKLTQAIKRPLTGFVQEGRTSCAAPNPPAQPRSPKPDTGRFSTGKPRWQGQDIPPGGFAHDLPSRGHNWHKDSVDSLRWAIDFAQAEKRVLSYCNLPMELLKSSASKPLAIRVKDIQVGQWLWHDKEHPSRVSSFLGDFLPGTVRSVRSRCGNVIFDWKAQKFADGYLLVLESTCK